MPKAYHIKDWDLWYESAETRKLKTLTYYGKPNKLVGEGIGFTLAQPDNLALLGMWALLEAVASTSERGWRGWLVRNGTPLTAERIVNLLGGRVPVEHVERALDHFAADEVRWLEYVDMPEQTPDFPPLKTPAPAANGRTPGESPATLPATATGEREVDRELEREGGNQEVGSDGLPWAAPLPSLSEVQIFATAARVPLDYVEAKLRAAEERKDFAKVSWQNGWRDKLKRFWKADAPKWGSEKNRAAAGPKNAAASARPDGWKDGDRERWWSDPLEALQAELSGAVLGTDEKNAARLREIIAIRWRSK